MSSEQVASVLRQTSMHGQRVKFIVARPIHTSLNNIELVGVNKDDEAIKAALREQLKQANNNTSQTNAIIIRTHEIMDKNIDLPNRIHLEADKAENETNLLQEQEVVVMGGDTDESTMTRVLDETIKTTDITVEEFQPLISTPTPSNKSILLETISYQAHKKLDISTTTIEAQDEEKKTSHEIDAYTIELNRLESITTSHSVSNNFIDNLNAELKIFGVHIDKDTNENNEETFYVVDAPKDASIEIYDHLIELNTKPVKQTQSIFLSDKLILKLYKSSFEFKSEKLKSKWLTQLKKDKYDVEEVNLEMCVAFDIEILVGLVDKTKSKNLGISLEGTVDVDDNGVETFPHHYIRSIMKSGPVDLAETKFQAGDELLEIDFFKLYAINYLCLLEILKGLKNKNVFMVCARKVKKSTPLPLTLSTVLDSDKKIGKIKAKSECFLSVESANLSSTVANVEIEILENKPTTTTKKPIENVIVDDTTKQDEINIDSQLLQSTNKNTNNTSSISKAKSKLAVNTPQMCVRSRSLELNSLSLWNTKIDFISLKKSEKG
jgi:hypothetical protein